MATVAPILTLANNHHASDMIGGLPLSDANLPVLVILMAVALVLGRALAAIVAAVLALLAPALALFRSLLLVIGLIVLLGLSMANGTDEKPAPGAPRDTGPSPTAVQPRPDPRASGRAPAPKAPSAVPSAKSSLAAPGR